MRAGGSRQSRRGTPASSGTSGRRHQQGQVFVIFPLSTVSTQTRSKRLREAENLRGVVHPAASGEAAGPGEDRGDRVVEVGLPLLVLAVVAGDGPVGRLGLDRLAVGAHQHARHQAERAEALGDGVGLDVAVVVFAGPDVTALPLQRGGDHVVDQAVFVGEAGGLELLLELGLVDLGEEVLEAPVVALEDRVLGRGLRGRVQGGVRGRRPHLRTPPDRRHGRRRAVVGGVCLGLQHDGDVPAVAGFRSLGLMTSVLMSAERPRWRPRWPAAAFPPAPGGQANLDQPDRLDLRLDPRLAAAPWRHPRRSPRCAEHSTRLCRDGRKRGDDERPGPAGGAEYQTTQEFLASINEMLAPWPNGLPTFQNPELEERI